MPPLHANSKYRITRYISKILWNFQILLYTIYVEYICITYERPFVFVDLLGSKTHLHKDQIEILVSPHLANNISNNYVLILFGVK